MARALTALAGVLLCTACLDFVEPEFPESGGPALLNVAVQIEAGLLRVDASLSPRIDRFGFVRDVPDDAIHIDGAAMLPNDTAQVGVRTYQMLVSPVPASIADGVEVIAPEIPGVEAPPLHINWVPAVQLGSDTLYIRAGEEIRLPIDPRLGMSDPPPMLRQWFLTMQSGSATLRISADAPPPPVLVIPPEFVPTDRGVISIVLVDRHTANYRPNPGDYIGVASLDTRLRWTVIVQQDTAS